MQIELEVVSHNEALLRLIREFAEGLGWTLGPKVPSGISLRQTEDSAGANHLLNVLTYMALSAAKTGGDASEPLCRIRYREGHASAVKLGIRIAEFDLSA